MELTAARDATGHTAAGHTASQHGMAWYGMVQEVAPANPHYKLSGGRRSPVPQTKLLTAPAATKSPIRPSVSSNGVRNRTHRTPPRVLDKARPSWTDIVHVTDDNIYDNIYDNVCAMVSYSQLELNRVRCVVYLGLNVLT